MLFVLERGEVTKAVSIVVRNIVFKVKEAESLGVELSRYNTHI